VLRKVKGKHSLPGNKFFIAYQMSKRGGGGPANMVNIAVLSLPIATFICHTKAVGNKNAFFIWLRDLFFRKKGEGAQNANFYFFALRDLQFSNFPRAEK